jgi:uncharacterized membrane protein
MGTSRRSLPGSGRAATFSDGIFAITITLLVLEIERPSFSEPGLARRLLENWSQYAAFAVSFVYIGALWLNHHALFAKIRRVDVKLNWINLLILGTTALLPFSTAVLAGAFGHDTPSSNRATAVALYALVALLMSAAWLPVFPVPQPSSRTAGEARGRSAADRAAITPTCRCRELRARRDPGLVCQPVHRDRPVSLDDHLPHGHQ